MEIKFKIGDVVCLNSSPEIKLTVTSIEDDEICVSYFDRVKTKLEYARLPLDAVKLYSSNVDQLAFVEPRVSRG